MIGFAGAIAAGEEVVRSISIPRENWACSPTRSIICSSPPASREKERLYTVNLEEMVQARTHALRESEEKYRTLWKNVRWWFTGCCRTDGRSTSISSSKISPAARRTRPEHTGLLEEKVWLEDRPRVWPRHGPVSARREEFRAEYRILHPTASLCTSRPACRFYDENGRLFSVGGFLVNGTERHQLQEQIIQTEELRTLSEISARLAHEIRNPLVVAGGFSAASCRASPSPIRRGKRPDHRAAVHAWRRSSSRCWVYLKPFEPYAPSRPLNNLVLEVVNDQQDLFTASMCTSTCTSRPNSPISWTRISPSGPWQTSSWPAGLCQPEQTLEVRTYAGERNAHLEMSLRGVRLSQDDSNISSIPSRPPLIAPRCSIFHGQDDHHKTRDWSNSGGRTETWSC